MQRTGFFVLTLLPPTGLISWTSSSRNLAQKKPQQKLAFPKEGRISQVTSDLNSFKFKCKNRAKEQDWDSCYSCSWEFQKVHSIGTPEVWRLGLWGRKEYSSERFPKCKEKSLFDWTKLQLLLLWELASCSPHSGRLRHLNLYCIYLMCTSVVYTPLLLKWEDI